MLPTRCSSRTAEAALALGRVSRAIAWLVAGLGASGCGETDRTSEPAPAASTAARAGEPEAPAYDHVVLVTLDTLRRDHLPFHGYVRDTAPFLARLAAEGVVFENALASVSHTAPSHATMLTGLPPRLHGVRRNGNKLERPETSLPALLRPRGFASGAFLGAHFLSGVAQGFDHVSAASPSTPQTVDRAIEWARAQAGGRYFLWLHLYEPHKWKKPRVPDWAREAVLADAPGDAAFYDVVARLHGLPAADPGEPFELPWSGADGRGFAHGPQSREDVVRYIDSYDALVRFADAEIGRLYAALEPEGSTRRGLWIATCDHGEGLGSHGYEGHGGRIYNEQLRVALVLHATDGSLGPRRVDALAGHVDLVPTLAELCGFEWHPPHPEFLGRSLVPLLAGASAGSERLAFAEQRRAEEAEAGDTGEMVAVQDRTHKLILYPDGREELFALGADPLELVDRAADDPRRAELRAALDARLRFFDALATDELAEPAPEYLEELRDLGYVR